MGGLWTTSAILLALCLSAHAQTTVSTVMVTNPQPTYTPDCDVAVIGGGPGGVYSAYRILEGGNSTNVCLLEATDRVGGRVYSVHKLGEKKDLTLDMGAYRYRPVDQPIITDLIQNLLEMENRLYQPGVGDYKIVLDDEGNNAGFATYVERLFELTVEMGLKAQFNSKVVKMESEGGAFVLTLFDGREVTADRVILNLPMRPLHRLLTNSNLPGSVYNPQLYAPYVNRATKLYLYYPRAWWLAAGLNNGSLSQPANWPFGANATFGNTAGIPIVGRYYDAQVKCPTKASMAAGVSTQSVQYKDYYYMDEYMLDTQNCYGFFQMIYTSDAGTTNTSHYPLDFMVDYAGALNFDTPYTYHDNTTAAGARLLQISHAALMGYHSSRNVSLPSWAASSPPTQAFVALWDQSVTWVGGGWHSMKNPIDTYYPSVQRAIKPYPGVELYVANEAYSTQLGWSEGSLVMAENIVRKYFNVPVPLWMQSTTATGAIFGAGFTDQEAVQQATAPPSVAAPAPAPAAMMG